MSKIKKTEKKYLQTLSLYDIANILVNFLENKSYRLRDIIWWLNGF